MGAAELIRVELARRCLSVNELATLTGLSQPTLSRRLREDSDFKLKELSAIADAFDMTLGDLVRKVEDPQKVS